jgi:hypothetical protein
MSKEVTAVLALLAVVSSAIGGAFAIFLFLDRGTRMTMRCIA